jgi:hypothetical protein
MVRTLPLLALALVGCSSAGFDSNDGTVASGDAPSTTGGSPSDSGSPTPTAPSAADADWYGIDAHLDLVGGELVLGRPTWFRVTLLDASLAVVCHHEVEISAATSEAPLAEGPAELGWWALELLDGVPDGEDCPAWAARELRLGVGPYDPRLDPALAAQQTTGQPPYGDDALYGLYVQEFEGGPLYVVGVVTIPGLVEGDLVSAPPLPDGNYEAHSLLLLSFLDG